MSKTALLSLLFLGIFGAVKGESGLALQDEFPYHAQIYKKGKFVCAGAIITPYVILTAATCVENYPVENIAVSAGSTDFIDDRESSLVSRGFQQIRRAEGYVVHPRFTSTCDFVNSLALLYLKEPFYFNKHVQAIALPKTEDFVDLTSAVRIGFGIGQGQCTPSPAYSPHLKKLSVSFEDDLRCKKLVRSKWDRKFRKEELCGWANVSSVEVCVMEKGSPVICKDDATSRPILCGIDAITTNKCKCQCQAYGITNNVQEFLEWIGDALEYITFRIKCDSEHFYCPSENTCLPRSNICDGKVDCPLEEDETDCANQEPCQDKSFRCNNGKCIPLEKRCNGEKDCEVKSNDYLGVDEEKCSENETGFCPEGLHSCGEKDRCFPGEWRCDNVKDCLDGSDEMECEDVESQSEAYNVNLPKKGETTKNWMNYGRKRNYNDHNRANKCVMMNHKGSPIKFEMW